MKTQRSFPLTPATPALLAVVLLSFPGSSSTLNASDMPEASAAESTDSRTSAVDKSPDKPAAAPPGTSAPSSEVKFVVPGPPPTASASESDAALLLEQAIQLQQTNAELKAARVLLEHLRDARDTPEIIRQEALRRLKQITPEAPASGDRSEVKSKQTGIAEPDPTMEILIPPNVHRITVSGEAEAKASSLQPRLNFSWNIPPLAVTKPAPNSLPGSPVEPDPHVSWWPPGGPPEDQWSAVFPKTPAPLSSDLRSIESLSLTEVSAGDLRAAAFDAIAKRLHPGAFFRPDDPADGTPDKPLTGVGILLSSVHSGVVCREILPNSPAARSGIIPGSELTKVNGQTVFALGATLEKVVKAVRGAEGTEVSLTLIPPGEPERTITLKRSLIALNPPPLCEPLARNPDGSPKWMLEDGVLGIQLNSMQPGNADEIRRLLENPAHQPLRALVLDVSQNGGGSVEEVSKILNLFLPKGGLYARREKGGSLAVVLGLPWSKPPFPDLPMTVLTSSATASSAEVMAAALQDHQRAKIIGQRTLGRTTIFQALPFQNGVMAVPVAELCRADGRGIERKPGMTEKDTWGVTPDITIAVSPPQQFNIRYSRQVPQESDPVFAAKTENPSDLNSAAEGTSSTPLNPNSKPQIFLSPQIPPKKPDQPLPQSDVLQTALKYLHEKLEAK